MKNRLFDRNLFRDGMRQLRIGGLVAAMVMGLQAVLVPIGKVVSSPPGVWESVGYLEMVPSMMLLFTVIAPLMALYLFRFLCQRNASDFYHAIPQTRICLYISFTAAVLCWALLLQVGTTALGCAVHLLFPRHFDIQWAQTALCSVQMFACVIFVTGAVMLAVTLTGNILTNLAASLLIIFFPRLLMLVINSCVGSNLIIVDSIDTYLPFLGNTWNVVTGTVFSVFTKSGNLFGSLRAGAYTAGIGLIYLILGCVMFFRRKSEAAGQASVGPKLQLIFRLLPAAVFCLLPNSRLYELLTGCEVMNAGTLYMLFVLYLIGVIIYFLYELLSTRSVKNLLKAVPGLAFLVVFNLLMVFGMLGMRRSLLSFTPSAEEIEYVQLAPEERFVWSDEGDGRVMPGYLSNRAGQIRLDEEEIRALVSARLAETVAYADLPVYERDEESQNSLMKKVIIRSGGRTCERVIRMLQTDVEALASALLEQPEMRDIYMNLPSAGDPEVKLSFGGSTDVQTEKGTRDTLLSGKDLEQIYAALQEDAADMGFEKWYTFCTDSWQANNLLGTLYMTVEDPEFGISGCVFPIGSITPKAWKVCQKMLWEGQKTARESLLNTMKDIAAHQNGIDSMVNISYTDAFITVYNTAESKEADYTVDLNSREIVETFIGLLEQQKDTPVDPEKGYMDVSCYVEYYLGDNAASTLGLQTVNYSDYRMFNGSLILALPEDYDFSAFTEGYGKG